MGGELYLANKLIEKQYLANTIIKIHKSIDSIKIFKYLQVGAELYLANKLTEK